MKELDHILVRDIEVLHFIRSRYPMYHLSNVFFRDIQYGIRQYLERKGRSIGYTDAEKIARAYTDHLEKKKILRPIDRQSWVVHYEEFRKPVAKPAATAKPAPEAKPVPSASTTLRPAGGLPPLKNASPAGAKPSSPPLKSSAPGGGNPSLPPLKSAKPAGVSPQSSQETSEKPAQHQETAPTPQVVAAPPTLPPSGTASSGDRKPLPPIRSSRPVGNK